MGDPRSARPCLTALVGALVFGLCGGCALLPSGVPVDDPEAVRLDRDVVAVVAYSPQDHDYYPLGNGNHGFLVVIHADGQVRILRTAFASQSQPAWGTAGVTARDSENRIVIGPDGARLVSDPTQSAQSNLVTGVSGYSSISLFDASRAGPGEPLETEIIAIGADGSSATESAPGTAIHAAGCPDGVIAETDMPQGRERFLSPSTGRDASTPYFYRLFPRPQPGTSDVVASVHADQIPVVTASLIGTCTEHRARFLAQGGDDRWRDVSNRSSVGLDNPDPGAALAYLRTVDTSSGTVTDLPLRAESGLPLPTGLNRTDANSLLGNELFWYAPTGIVYATDVTTGLTREAFHTGPESVNVRVDDHIDDESVVQFGPGRLFRVSMPRDLGDRDPDVPTVTGWDLATGAQTLKIEVPAIADIAEEPGHFQRPWGVAMNPEVLRTGALPE